MDIFSVICGPKGMCQSPALHLLVHRMNNLIINLSRQDRAIDKLIECLLGMCKALGLIPRNMKMGCGCSEL